MLKYRSPESDCPGHSVWPVRFCQVSLGEEGLSCHPLFFFATNGRLPGGAVHSVAPWIGEEVEFCHVLSWTSWTPQDQETSQNDGSGQLSPPRSASRMWGHAHELAHDSGMFIGPISISCSVSLSVRCGICSSTDGATAPSWLFQRHPFPRPDGRNVQGPICRARRRTRPAIKL